MGTINFDEMRLRAEQIANNKATRALICLCIDNSFSMSGARINIVNSEIDKFLKNMYENRTARDSVEICVVSFGHEVEVKCNFGPIKEAITANKTIIADGSRTELGAGVKKGLELLDEHISVLKSGGNKYYKPWVIIISDGEATDKKLCESVSANLRERQKTGEVKVKCLSMGDSAETESLKKFSIDGEVEQIDTIETMEFFSMLSRSISSVSQSRIQNGEF